MRGLLQKLSSRRGAASLPAILLLGGIIVEISIAGVILLFYLNNSIYGARLADEALSAAQSGINDAVMQVILDSSSSGSYAISLTNGSTAVEIDQNIISPKYRVTSVGTVLTRERTLEAILTVDSTTGLVTIDSIKEIQ